MRILPFMLAIFVLTAGIGTPAQAQNYPWCAQYSCRLKWAAPNCGVHNFCSSAWLTLAGMGGFCNVPITQYCSTYSGTCRPRDPVGGASRPSDRPSVTRGEHRSRINKKPRRSRRGQVKAGWLTICKPMRNMPVCFISPTDWLLLYHARGEKVAPESAMRCAWGQRDGVPCRCKCPITALLNYTRPMGRYQAVRAFRPAPRCLNWCQTSPKAAGWCDTFPGRGEA